MYAPNNKDAKYMKQNLIELKEESYKSTITKSSTILSQQLIS
jgi:hypothetical protein